ncbi:MAG: tRNA 2-thiouridine(34) synthase MnmA [Eubacteriales bacterium]|nr:tRNA 2-thiouridine(34) synthase MnmA [Eubacteriales bacterium]
MSRVVVGLSGGVDSAVAALLLKRQGHEVIGLFMDNWEETDENGVCTAHEDWADVRGICQKLDIPHYSVSFAQEYTDRVFDHFLAEYRQGRTPNPDVLCNREIKFGAFLDYALKLDADYMATGHFVRRDAAGNLYKGADTNKDQSYFLYMTRAGQLRHALFPLGEMKKPQVRQIAREAGLPVSEKKDSTGICFIGERRFKQFLQQYLPARPGDMVAEDGEILGSHDGLMYYTIGQRRGLGIGGRGDGRSWFVAGKDLEHNRLLLVQGEDHPMLYAKGALVEQITWVNEAPCVDGVPYHTNGKLRYRQPDQGMTLTISDGTGKLDFDTPQRAVTPGQSAVLYDGDLCLGGGIITSAL